MKKRLGTFVATGALALGALAGTVGSANATAVTPDYHGQSGCGTRYGCFEWDGPYPDSKSCVDYVWLIGQLGRWDCEYYVKAWFDPLHNTGWYATSVPYPR